jgi:hypothetical protein
MNVRLRTKKKVAPLNRAALRTEDGATFFGPYDFQKIAKKLFIEHFF